MAKTEDMVKVLKDLGASTPGVEASAVVSLDGFVIASALPADTEEDKVAAMAAATLSLGERSADELNRGSFEQLFIKGDNGYIVLLSAGKEAILIVLARVDAKLGLIFLDAKRAAEKIEKFL
jgi:hypothetical protein